MPYLPSRRFRPAGNYGNYNPVAQQGPGDDPTMPEWLRSALAGASQPSPSPTPQPRDQAREYMDAIRRGEPGAIGPSRDQGREYVDAVRRGEPGAIGPRDQGREMAEAVVYGRGRGTNRAPEPSGAIPFWEEIGNWWPGSTPNRMLQEFIAPKPSNIPELGSPYEGGGGFIDDEVNKFLQSLGNFELPGTGVGGGVGPLPASMGGGGGGIEGAPDVLDTLGALVGDAPRGTMAENRAGFQEWLSNLFPASRFEPKPGVMGNIQEFFAPSPAGEYQGRNPYAATRGEPQGPDLLEGIANFVGNFVLPGTENIPHATTTDRPGGEGGGAGTFYDQGDNQANLQALSDLLGIPIDELINRGLNPTQIPGAYQTGNIMQDAWLATGGVPVYDTTGPVGPSFSGAGGGGFGGFNFAPGDPADPRFWLDMVRWLI
ncbi:hypothetical protein LCGC14_0929590 [marine sediment metagenome]|uniref:Uncharacterized protein n=1 Tax=marine sediment metagenome TaxID=412755 RepID=A0A0F9RUY7_9ZZZZ